MPLDDDKLLTDIKAAFKATTWSTCGTLLGNAINDYVCAGLVKMDVTGTVTPPSGVPYQATGAGVGAVFTTGVDIFISSINTSFSSTDWNTTGVGIADAIDTIIKNAEIRTTDSSILEGTGKGSISPTMKAYLTARMIIAFTEGEKWDDISSIIAEAIKTFITTPGICSTTDSGTTPPVSWVGTGTGAII